MGAVRFGVDVLVAERLELVRGKRIGLVTNHTGFDSRERPTVDILAEEPSVDLAVLFGPEHGIRGDLDTEGIPDGVDRETGIPVRSLFGAVREPTREMLDGLDAIVYDIEDVGARFYTYITTLSGVMKTAGECGVPVVVLDRPNPSGGTILEGPMLDTEFRSFVGPHELPMRHGMTVGELARMYVGRFGVRCDLRVVPCDGWRRGMFYGDTGLPWKGPSPNLHTVEQAILYPGPCLLEMGNLSVGRGTQTPFELIGAPWVDRNAVTEVVRGSGLAGVEVEPATFTPKAGTGYPHAGSECHGLRMRLTDPVAYRALPLGAALLVAFRDQCRDFQLRRQGFEQLAGSRRFVEAFYAGARFSELVALAWQGMDDFRERREEFLIYRD